MPSKPGYGCELRSVDACVLSPHGRSSLARGATAGETYRVPVMRLDDCVEERGWLAIDAPEAARGAHPAGASSPGLRIIFSTSAMCCSSSWICARAYSSIHTLLSRT